MSLPRLPFLYPFLRRSIVTTPRRYRHGSAVEPTQLHPDPPPTPPPPRGDSDVRGPGDDVTADMLEIAGRDPADLKAEDAAPKTDETSVPPPTTPTSLAETDRPFAPRDYTHHFDTYTSVQRLSAGSFTQSQSIVTMKLLRALLDKNLTAARENLVSKSNIENETYLFQAACSELRNEMQNAKNMAVEELRGERTRIQTEFDLLNQKFLAEIMGLRDELSSMFNDRKMVTRAEQRAMENKIQELNYKITILINSDLKSEIEKLRWTTTRRGLIAIACLALFVVTSIRVNNSSHDRAKKKSKKKEREEEDDRHEKPFDPVPIPGAEAAESGLVSLG